MPKTKSKHKKEAVEIGQRIRRFRKSQDLTQQDFSKSLDIHFQSLLRYEKGTIVPGSDLLLKMKDLYAVNPNWILLGIEPQYLSEDGTQVSAYRPTSSGASFAREPLVDYRITPAPGSVVDFIEVPVVKSLKNVKLPLTKSATSVRMAIPKMWLTRPDETFIVKADKDNMNSVIRQGDIVAVDWSQRNASELDGSVVLARIKRGVSFKRLGNTPAAYLFEDDKTSKPILVRKRMGNPIMGKVLFICRSSKS